MQEDAIYNPKRPVGQKVNAYHIIGRAELVLDLLRQLWVADSYTLSSGTPGMSVRACTW